MRIRILSLLPLLLLPLPAFASETAEAEPAAVEAELAAAPETRAATLPSQLAAMEETILRYRAIVAQGGWPEIPEGPTFRPGERDARVESLRDILLHTGDFIGYAPDSQPEDKTLYDPELELAAKQFQARHALEADGAIGAKTQKALNVSAEDRLAQLEINAARLRRFMESHPITGRAVLVNIAGYSVLLPDEQGELTRIRAITGRPDRQTPLLESRLSYVHFNPSWYVPTKIASKDLLPKIEKDPEFLQKGGYTIRMDGEEIDPALLDIEEMRAHPGRFALRQQPGDDNALGRIKFSFPNEHAVYLHSTSHPALFKKASRALSSGCIRVEDPRALAHYVLEGGKVTPEEIDRYYDGTAQKSLPVRTPIPVYLLYWTAWISFETGLPEFYPDIYGKDAGEKTRLEQEKKSALPASHPPGI